MSVASIQVAQIAAISDNRCIGKGNDLPWHISADLQHFKQLTTEDTSADIQGIVIMGRKTFESMGSKPLPKRVSFIISSQLDYAKQKGLIGHNRAYVQHDLQEALTQASQLATAHQLKTIWLIGGERVFSEALPVTDRIELTHVDTEIIDGDAFYPQLPIDFRMTQKSNTMYDDKSGLSFTFATYQK